MVWKNLPSLLAHCNLLTKFHIVLWVLIKYTLQSHVYWTVHHCDSWWIKDQLDVTCYFISLPMCSTCFGRKYIHHQELATILLNYQIGRIVLGSMCVGDSVWLGWSGISVAACNMETTPTQTHRNSNTHRTKNNMTNAVIQENSCKLLMVDILMSETCWAHKWNKTASDIKLVFYSSTTHCNFS